MSNTFVSLETTIAIDDRTADIIAPVTVDNLPEEMTKGVIGQLVVTHSSADHIIVEGADEAVAKLKLADFDLPEEALYTDTILLTVAITPDEHNIVGYVAGSAPEAESDRQPCGELFMGHGDLCDSSMSNHNPA